MTENEFISEAKRRGFSKEETYAKYEKLKAAGRFTPAPTPAPVQPPPPPPVQQAPVAPTAPVQPPVIAPPVQAAEPVPVQNPLASFTRVPSRTEFTKMGGNPRSSYEERRAAWKAAQPPPVVPSLPAGQEIYGPENETNIGMTGERMKPNVLTDVGAKLAAGVAGLPNSAVGALDTAAALGTKGLKLFAELGAQTLGGYPGAVDANMQAGPEMTAPSVGRALEDAGLDLRAPAAYVEENVPLSTGQAAADEKMQADLQAAEGFFRKVGAVATNPRAVWGMALENLPQMALSGGVARVLGAANPTFMKTMMLSAGFEAGLSGGETGSRLRVESEDRSMEGSDVAGALTVAAGTFAFSMLGNVISGKLGVGDVDVLFAGGSRSAQRSVLSKAIAGGLDEISPLMADVVERGIDGLTSGLIEALAEELPQTAVEKIVTNVRMGKDWRDGLEDELATAAVTAFAISAPTSVVTSGGSAKNKGKKESQGTFKDFVSEMEQELVARTEMDRVDEADRISSLELEGAEPESGVVFDALDNQIYPDMTNGDMALDAERFLPDYPSKDEVARAFAADADMSPAGKQREPETTPAVKIGRKMPVTEKKTPDQPSPDEQVMLDIRQAQDEAEFDQIRDKEYGQQKFIEKAKAEREAQMPEYEIETAKGEVLKVKKNKLDAARKFAAGDLRVAQGKAMAGEYGKKPKLDDRGDIIDWYDMGSVYPEGWDGVKAKRLESALKNVDAGKKLTKLQAETLADAMEYKNPDDARYEEAYNQGREREAEMVRNGEVGDEWVPTYLTEEEVMEIENEPKSQKPVAAPVESEPPPAPVTQKVPEKVKSKGMKVPSKNWREAFDGEADVMRKGDVLKAIANTKSTAQEQSDVLDRLDGIAGDVEAASIAYDVSQNPASSPETKARALALREKLMAPAKSKGTKPAADLIPAAEQPFNLVQESVPSPERVIAAKEREAENLRKAEEAQVKMELDVPAAKKVEVKSALQNVSLEKQAKADELKKRLREKLSRVSMNVDPTVVTDLAQLGLIYVEGGAKTFAQFAQNVKVDVDDLWDKVKDDLRTIWSDMQKENPDLEDIGSKAAQKVIERIDAGEPAIDLPPEPKTMKRTDTENLTSLQESVISTQRPGEYTPGGQRTFPELLADAEAAFEQNASAGKQIFARIEEGHIPDDGDIAIMTVETGRRKKALESAEKSFAALKKSGASIAALDVAEQNLRDAAKDMEYAWHISAVGNDAVTGQPFYKSRIGAALNALKMTLDEKFELVNLTRLYQIKKGYGNAMLEEEIAMLKEVNQRWKDANAKLEEVKTDLEKKYEDARDVFEEAQEEIKRLAAIKELEGEIRKNVGLDKLAAWGQERRKNGNAKLKALLGRASDVTGVIAETVAAIAEITAGLIAEGTANLTQAVITELGDLADRVKPYLEDGIRQGRKMYASELAQRANERIKPSMADTETMMKREIKAVEIVETAKVELSDQIEMNDILANAKIGHRLPPLRGTKAQFIQKLYDYVFANGVTDMNSSTEMVQRLLREIYRDQFSPMSDTEVRRMFSGYGTEPKGKPDPSNIRDTRNELRRQAQLLEAIIDAEQGIAPKKTGKARKPDSDRVRELKRMKNQVMRDMKLNPTETNALRSSMQSIETRLKNEIRDLEAAIAAEKPLPGPKAAEAYSELAKQRRERRNELKAIYDRMFPKESKSVEDKLADAISYAEEKLAEMIQAHKDAVAGKFKIAGPKQKLPPNADLDLLTAQIELLRADINKMKAADPVYAIKARINRIRAAEAALDKKIALNQFFTPEPALPIDVSVTPEGAQALADLAKVKLVYAQLKHDADWANMGPLQRLGEYAMRARDAHRAIRASYDLSGLGRQGGKMLRSNPIIWLKTVPLSFKTLISKQASIDYWNRFATRPNYASGIYKRAKLKIAEGDGMGSFGKLDDMWEPQWAEKWYPGVKQSDRSFGHTLNHLRAELFDKLLANSSDPTDVSTVKIKQIADFVNSWTGSGTTLPDVRSFGLVLWAPKFLESQIEFLTGKFLFRDIIQMPGASEQAKVRRKYANEVRKMAAMQYARYIAGLAAIYGTAAMMKALTGGGEDGEQWDITWEPKYLTSSLIGAIKIGNQYFNPLGDYRPMLTFLARLATGENTTSSGERRIWNEDIAWLADEEMEAKGEDRNADRFILQFMRSKMAPAVSFAWEMYRGRDFSGQKASRLQMIVENLTPIPPWDWYDAVKTEDGLVLGMTIMANILGESVRPDYNLPHVKWQLESEEDRRKTFGRALWDGGTENTRKNLHIQEKRLDYAKEHYDYLREIGISDAEIKAMVMEQGDRLKRTNDNKLQHWNRLKNRVSPKKRK